MTAFWRGTAPIVLASQSQARKGLLLAAGIPFEVCGAGIDERRIEEPLVAAGAKASEVALHLSREKALRVATQKPARLVAGADQVLCLKGQLYPKPSDRVEAIAQLKELSGRTHELYSACCVARGGAVLFETVSIARLKCRKLSPAFIEAYAAEGGLESGSVYQIEGLGIHLFDAIEGDFATILGLPLLPLLKFLREEGSLLS